MREILQHPTSHNIEWHDVVSLLEAIGTVEVHRDNKVEIHVDSDRRPRIERGLSLPTMAGAAEGRFVAVPDRPCLEVWVPVLPREP